MSAFRLNQMRPSTEEMVLIQGCPLAGAKRERYRRVDALFALMVVGCLIALSSCATTEDTQPQFQPEPLYTPPIAPPTTSRNLEFYPSGALWKATRESSSTDFKQESTFYQDGRLAAESYTALGSVVILTFYPSGRLQAEERYAGEALSYARYYDKEGRLIDRRGKGELPRKPPEFGDEDKRPALPEYGVNSGNR